MIFIKQFLKSPFTIGSVCPSGKALSQTLVNMAVSGSGNQHGLIIDLGAGTGVVSKQLLEQGIQPEEILAIDICSKFTNIFNANCRPITLHIGDARNLRRIISEKSPHIPVLAIISSLPLKSMPASLVTIIMTEIWRILNEQGGALVQYTYAFWLHSSLSRYGFQLASKRYVAHNIPPCLVEKYYIKK